MENFIIFGGFAIIAAGILFMGAAAMWENGNTQPAPTNPSPTSTAQPSASKDDGDFATSVAIGYLTHDAIIGGIVGGDFAGGFIGNILNSDDE